MNIQPVALHGKHANLVPLTMNHLDELWEASNRTEVWTYMPTKVTSKSECKAFLETALRLQAEGTDLPFAVTLPGTGRVIGSTRFLNISKPNRHLEIGWTWYDPSAWRTGVNTECKYMLMKHSFEVLEAVRVQICVDARNERSNQAVLRLGATKEGVLRRHRVLSDGFIRDTCVYSVIDHDWPTVKARLEHLLYEKYV